MICLDIWIHVYLIDPYIGNKCVCICITPVIIMIIIIKMLELYCNYTNYNIIYTNYIHM